MDSRKILKEAMRGCDRGDVAKAVGISLGSLNNQIAGESPYFPKGQTQNLLERVYNLIDATYGCTGKMVVLEKLAEEFGFMLIANPVIRSNDSPALHQIAGILREFATLIDAIGNAHADGTIDSQEAENIRGKWEILKRIAESFVLSCETGTYAAAKKNGSDHEKN